MRVEDVVALNSVGMDWIELAIPIQFIPAPWDKSDSIGRAHTVVRAMCAVGFDVVVDQGDGHWRALVDPSVMLSVKLADRAFAPRDVAQFAWLAWRVHVDETVDAAYRLGGMEAAVAMLTSEWVLAQGAPP